MPHVDEQSLPQEEREFRSERRNHWPTRSNVERKKREEAERKQRGELPSESVQKRRLREVLAKQRKLGHHEASQECKAVLVPCKYFLNGRCNKGRKCAYSHDPAYRSKQKSSKKRKEGDSEADDKGPADKTEATRNTKRQKSSKRQAKGPGKGGLLRKVLEPEMRAEHSQLLQAFRFIVNNNFLLDDKDPSALDYAPWNTDEDTAAEIEEEEPLSAADAGHAALSAATADWRYISEHAGDAELEALTSLHAGDETDAGDNHGKRDVSDDDEADDEDEQEEEAEKGKRGDAHQNDDGKNPMDELSEDDEGLEGGQEESDGAGEESGEDGQRDD